MSKLEKMFMELAEEARKEKKNFLFAIEDDGIQSQSSVRGNSPLREIAKTVKNM